MPDNQDNIPQANTAFLADFTYACAMLKRTPRSGYAFLGTGRESVAEHTFGAAAIGYALARRAGADAARTVFICLFHDLHEAATGDFNYVNQRYDSCDAMAALADICRGTGLQEEILALFAEFEARESLEARLARDADQLDFICALRQQLATGNEIAGEWLKTARERVKTDQGRELLAAILATDPAHWWYAQVDKSWWIERRKP